MDNIVFYEFEKILLAYVWVNIKTVINIHPGILIIKKPFNIKNLNKSALKNQKYFLYININGVLKSINIKNVTNLTNRTEYNAKDLLQLYTTFELNKNKPREVINKDFLK